MGVESAGEGVEKTVSPVSWAVGGGSRAPDGGFDGDRTDRGSRLERQDRRWTAGKAHQCQARDRRVKLGQTKIAAADIVKVVIRMYRASAGAAGSPPAAGGRCDSEDIGP